MDEIKSVTDNAQFIVIKIGQEQFGIDIQHIDNIVRMQNITRVPKVPDYFKGVINLRGEIIPVMSIRGRFGMEDDVYTDKTRIIILKPEQQEAIGILVDSVKEVVSLEEGNIEKVNDLLGYRYFVLGEVVHGRQLGRTWGLPTINQVPEDGKLLPPFGVYASKTFIKGKTFYGISNVGVKPTVEVPFAGVETYLFDCDEDLYGEEAWVEFYHFVRPECKFDSVEELKAQIQRDANAGKQYFQKRGLHS